MGRVVKTMEMPPFPNVGMFVLLNANSNNSTVDDKWNGSM